MRNAKCKIIPGQFEFCNSHFAFSNSPASQQTRSTPFALNSPYSGLFISPVPTRLLSRAASCPEPPPVPSLLLSQAFSCPKPPPSREKTPLFVRFLVRMFSKTATNSGRGESGSDRQQCCTEPIGSSANGTFEGQQPSGKSLWDAVRRSVSIVNGKGLAPTCD